MESKLLIKQMVKLLIAAPLPPAGFGRRVVGSAHRADWWFGAFWWFPAGLLGRWVGVRGAAAEESQLRNKPVLVLCVPAAGAAG